MRTHRHDAGRVHPPLAAVIVPLDLRERYRLGHARLLIEVAHVIAKIGIFVDVPPVAFEVRIVDRIEADQRAEKAPVRLGTMPALPTTPGR